MPPALPTEMRIAVPTPFLREPLRLISDAPLEPFDKREYEGCTQIEGEITGCKGRANGGARREGKRRRGW